jgi:hypothetical protein
MYVLSEEKIRFNNMTSTVSGMYSHHLELGLFSNNLDLAVLYGMITSGSMLNTNLHQMQLMAT